MAKKARFAINVDSGVVTYRSESTDALQTIWKLVDDETAVAIVKKKIDAKSVVEAIQKSIVRDEGFNWKEYDARRREELKLYNVSQRDMVPDGDSDPNAKTEDAGEDVEVLSLKELGLTGADGADHADKPEAKQSGKKQKTPEKNDGENGIGY